MTPYHKTAVFWLAILTTLYTAAAGAVASMSPVFAESLPLWIRASIAIVGVALPVATALYKRWEAPKPPKYKVL